MSERDQTGYFHVDCELSEYMVKNRFWAVPSKMARLMTDGEYALEGFEEPVVFTRGPTGNNRLKRFLAKAISMGLKAGDRFELAMNPDTRKMRVGKVAVRPDFSLVAPPSGV